MDLPVILLLDEDDLVFTMRALATGVLLCITKPVPIEIAECLWQVVAGEKIRKGKKMEQFRQLTTPRRLHNGVREEDLGKGCSSGNTSLDDSHKSKKKMKCSKNANQEDNSIFKRKIWIDWTQELHERFVYAIRKLGEGKCYPKDILELMNVPGLTRMQVASHLQKCRRGTYPAGRNLKIAAPMPTSGETSNPAKSKRYGSMPPLLFNHVQENYENYQDQVPMMGSSKGDNVLGCDNEELSVEVYNPFSDVGVEATNMEQAFDMDDMFTAEEKFVLDAQSVAPTPNTSLDAQGSVTDEFFEFPDMDILIQNFYASKQAPIDDGGSSVALDFDQVYSSENEASVVLGAEKSEYGDMSKTEESGETEGLKLEE